MSTELQQQSFVGGRLAAQLAQNGNPDFGQFGRKGALCAPMNRHARSVQPQPHRGGNVEARPERRHEAANVVIDEVPPSAERCVGGGKDRINDRREHFRYDRPAEDNQHISGQVLRFPGRAFGQAVRQFGEPVNRHRPTGREPVTSKHRPQRSTTDRGWHAKKDKVVLHIGAHRFALGRIGDTRQFGRQIGHQRGHNNEAGVGHGGDPTGRTNAK